jgi:hypothetical protein
MPGGAVRPSQTGTEPRVRGAVPGEENGDMSVSGVLIAESLSKTRPFLGVTLQVRKVTRSDVGDVSAGQPLTWTFIEFEVEEHAVTDLVGALCRSLDPAGGWYCDFRTTLETFVVFAGHFFRYPRGDGLGRAEAEAYGRSVGVPAAQLDWAE